MQHDTHRPIANIVSSPGALHETIEEIIDLAIAENNEEKPLKLRFITPLFVEAWITDENYCDFKITSPDEHEPKMDFVSVSYCWNHTQSMVGLPMLPDSLHYLVPVDPTFTLPEYLKPRMAGNDLHVDASNISATRGYREKFTTSPSEIPAPENFSSPFAENGRTSMPMRPGSEHPWNLVLLQTFDAMDKCDNFLVADRVSILGNICDLPRRLLSNRLNDPKYSYSICLMTLFLANCLPDPAERLNYLQVAWGSTLQHTIRDVFKEWELFQPSTILKAKKKGWVIDDISRRMRGSKDHETDLQDVTDIEL
ncbi:unnamed protein product [Alternaria alternata]